MKKIFHMVSNKEWGGGEQYVYDLCQRQRADGCDVAVFCKSIPAVADRFASAGIPVQTLPLTGMLDCKSAWHMSQAVGAAVPCTIHAHNFKDAFTAAYARRLTANPNVRVVMCRHLTRPGKDSWYYRWLYSQLHCLCFDSDLSRNTFLSTHPTVDPAKLRVVHTSVVVPPSLQPAPLRQEFGIPADCVVGMFHGRLDPEKGLDTLIEAAAMLPDRNFRLVLVGRGTDEYTAHLTQLIQEKGLADCVILAGFRHPVLPFVAAADFGILPSTVSEGCPLSPQEYMSQAHPVIATNNGGQVEYIQHLHNGLLVPPADPIQLTAMLTRLISDNDLRHRLGQQAKADFDDHLNYEHFYSQIRLIYEDSLS